MSTSIEDQLDNMQIQIHFKENSIPSIHAGKMTKESKAQLLDLFVHLASEAKPEKMKEELHAGYEFSSTGNEHNKAIDTYHNNILKAIGKQ